MVAPAPRENHEKKIDFLNPVEVAKFGYEKSIAGLQALLGKKREAIATLKTEKPREKDQLAVARESINSRYLLAQEIRLA